MKDIARIFLGFIILVSSCTKSRTVYQGFYYTPPVSPMYNKAWVLTEITINNTPQTLTPLQSSFYMTIYATGLYTDSYGVSGYWTKPVNDSLKISKSILGVINATSYAIEKSDSLNLILSQTSANQKVVYKYISLGVVSTTPPTNLINTTWQLNSINTNGQFETLTTSQKMYKMTLNSNGSFWDADGVLGTWNFPASDSLKIYYGNLPTPISVTYKINTLTAANLNITKYINNVLTTFDYLAAPVSSSVLTEKWQLKELQINDITQTLTLAQANYLMNLTSNGVFTDTDGSAGIWTSPSSDSLVINKTNLVTPVTIRYRILSKTNVRMTLQHNTGAQKNVEIYEVR